MCRRILWKRPCSTIKTDISARQADEIHTKERGTHHGTDCYRNHYDTGRTVPELVLRWWPAAAHRVEDSGRTRNIVHPRDLLSLGSVHGLWVESPAHRDQRSPSALHRHSDWSFRPMDQMVLAVHRYPWHLLVLDWHRPRKMEGKTH